MKSIFYLLFSVSILISLSFTACSGKKPDNKQSEVAAVKKQVVIGNETSLLLKDLQENGDYVNSQVFPSLIKASVVHESLGKNLFLIDLRSPELFIKGHIKGAVNKKFEELPAFFETGIKPFEFDKIIIVCEDGQLSSLYYLLIEAHGIWKCLFNEMGHECLE